MSGASASAAETSCSGAIAGVARGGVGGDDARIVPAGRHRERLARRQRASALARRRRAAAKAGAGRPRAWRTGAVAHRTRDDGAPQIAASDKPDLRELRRAQVRFVRAEEFVELRRLDRAFRRASRAPVRDGGSGAGRDARGAASRSRAWMPARRSTAIGSASCASVSVAHAAIEPAIDRVLRGGERRAGRRRAPPDRRSGRRRGWAAAPREAALERVDVIPVDGEVVVERRLERGEEARARARRNRPARACAHAASSRWFAHALLQAIV